MKAKLLAIAALLASGAGVMFVSWNDPVAPTDAPFQFGAFEVVDRSMCEISACNTAACTAALNHLKDGGVTDAVMRFIDCPVRFGPRMVNRAADAGMALSLKPDGGAAKYQHVRFIAMRRPNDKGGVSTAIAVDDAGWPVHAVTTATFPCAWKPNAGAACARVDGGNPGIENTMQPGQWSGAGCVRKACVGISGDPE